MMKLPPYDVFPVIRNEVITLRQIQPADIEDIIEISFYDTVQAVSYEQALEMQMKINKDYNDGQSIHWGISENITNKITGTCGFYRGFRKGIGELGCVLLPQFRGKGLMTAALLLAIDFGINNMKLNGICAVTTSQNLKAISLLERLDFIQVANQENDELKYILRSQELPILSDYL